MIEDPFKEVVRLRKSPFISTVIDGIDSEWNLALYWWEKKEGVRFNFGMPSARDTPRTSVSSGEQTIPVCLL